MKTKFMAAVLLLSTLTYSQRTNFYYEKSSAISLGGAIQNLESEGNDRIGTGQIGFKQENFFGSWGFDFTVASTLEAIKSKNVRDYANMILNPFNTQNGIGDALNISFFRRSFFRPGAVASHALYLFSIDDSIKTRQEYRDLISEFGLKKYKKFIYQLGFLADFNVSNFQWTDQRDSTLGGNLISLNPYLIYDQRNQFSGNDVNFFIGLGPSIRLIGGGIKSDTAFLRSILGSSQKSYYGVQATLQATINNFYAKAYYGIYNSLYNVDGLTSGSFFITIGIRSKFGQIKKMHRPIQDLAFP